MDAPIAQNKKANRGVGTSEYGNGPRSRRREIKGFCYGKKPTAHAHDRGGFITVVERPISPASRFSKMPFVERFFTKENRRNRGFPAGVVEVRLIPRPVIRLAWGALPAPEVPRRLIIDQRHRLAKRQPGKERQSKQKAPSRPVFEIIHAGGNVANRPRYSMPQWLRY